MFCLVDGPMVGGTYKRGGGGREGLAYDQQFTAVPDNREDKNKLESYLLEEYNGNWGRAM